jgi:hypothetical protein
MFARTFYSSGKRRLALVALSSVVVAALVAGLGITVLALGAHTAFGSSSGGGGCFSTGGPVCTYKDHTGYADFGSVSPDGCLFTDAFVQPFENLTSPGHNASQSVYVNINVWNYCTSATGGTSGTSGFSSCGGGCGGYVSSVSNVDPVTGIPAFTGTVQFGTQLSSATVNGTATMFDNFTGAQVFTSTINLSWHAYGPSSTFIDSSHYRAPGFLLNTHSHGTSSAAAASGTFTDQSGTNLATPATLNASLNNDSGGQVQLSRS